MILIDGKQTSQKVKDKIKLEVDALKTENKPVPCLSVILVGENPASQIYVRNKVKSCEETGILSQKHTLPEETSQKELLDLISNLNNDKSIHGILVQMPLPKHIDEQTVIEAIDPKKDVDAFHPINVGKVMLGLPSFAPCTPSGIITLLDEYNIDIAGKHCVVVGRSNIVGKPMALLLLKRHGTVTICHSRTSNLSEITKTADILVAAVGKAKIIDGSMIKPGAVVIDVGMNRENGKLCGDVYFDSCRDIASYITPVPGGVGPMTIATLLENTLKSAKNDL